eukprot:TRINITY_DN19876_c0_g1_i1.p1 TRINITY_DN19876_c0_g1~~TRINITY_DN19876_c0_g1_i1.p1  ORF type:complete len:725 (+),score=274.11 TRINITY_DN19876_c0_g1_i1:64-2238(+)
MSTGTKAGHDAAAAPPTPATPNGVRAAPEGDDRGAPPDSGGFTYYLFHPYGRLFTAVSLTICNFMLYGEDPVVHAYTEAELPVGGQALSLVAFDWPDMAGMVFVKCLVAIICVVVGMIVGRLVVHDLFLRDMFKLSFCGWEYHDLDDIRTSEMYGVFKTDTPYNRQWWGGEKDVAALGVSVPAALKDCEADTEKDTETKAVARPAYEKGWEGGVASCKTGGLHKSVLGADVPTKGKPYDYTREQYEEEEQTMLELVFPWFFKPRKHRDHSKGSVLVMFGTTILVMFLGAIIYNEAILTVAYSGANYKKYKLGPGLGMNEWEFGKFAACLCWIADLLNLITAFDSAFQEIAKHQTSIVAKYKGSRNVFEVLAENAYKRPKIADKYDADEDVREIAGAVAQCTPRMKLGYIQLAQTFAPFWVKKIAGQLQVRHLVVLIFSATLTVLVLVAVAFDVANWDEWSDEYGFNLHSTEFSRLILASAIAIQGPLTIIQDLEWPSFSTDDPDIKLPGLDIDHVECNFCCMCSRGGDTEANRGKSQKVPFTSFFITNKWITFIPFVLSLGLDHAMLYACWEYHPALYGQYVNPHNNRICVTRNETYAKEIKDAWEKDKTLIANYTERFNAGYLDDSFGESWEGTDFCLPSRFTGVDSSAKFWAALPGVLMYVFFVFFLIKWTLKDKVIQSWEEPRDSVPPSDERVDDFLGLKDAAATAPDTAPEAPLEFSRRA